MKVKVGKMELRDLILDGISTEELHLKYDYSNITDMSCMFYNCTSLKEIPELNTENVTDMHRMFDRCTSLKEIPELNTENVTNMSCMFYDCPSLIKIPGLNTEHVTDFRVMIRNCSSLEEVFYNENINYIESNSKIIKSKCPEHFI